VAASASMLSVIPFWIRAGKTGAGQIKGKTLGRAQPTVNPLPQTLSAKGQIPAYDDYAPQLAVGRYGAGKFLQHLSMARNFHRQSFQERIVRRLWLRIERDAVDRWKRGRATIRRSGKGAKTDPM
jgi:hypothetical protein